MRPNERLSLLGSRLFVIGAGALVVVMVCAGLALAFTDVSSGDDYAEAIDELSRLQIITGFEDGSFRPDALVTRQQFAKMIVRTLGLPVSESDICPFSDVERSGPDELYPDNYIAVCARNEITKGKTATTFDPYSNITRAQLMTMVVRAAPLGGFTLEQPTNEYYSDSRHIFRNFEDANHGLNARIAEVNGLLWGIRLEGTGTWDPWKKATRGEVAQVLWRLRQKAGSGATTTTSTTGPTTTTSSTTTTLVTSDGYESLGGTLLSGPAVAAPGVGHLAVFVRGSGGTLWTKQYKDNGWSTWQDLGGQIASDPAAISWGEGRIDVFVRGVDNALWHRWHDGQNWHP